MGVGWGGDGVYHDFLVEINVSYLPIYFRVASLALGQLTIALMRVK